MQKILILAALPDKLRLDREIREIEEAIRRAVKRDSFEIKIRTAVRTQDIRRALAEEHPQIVHFCGHGQEDGSLVLENDSENYSPVLPMALAALFKLHTDYVECVLLNACYSAKPAAAISKHINHVIGINQQIQDRAAIVFAQGFYDGLVYDNVNNDVIQRAFEEGIVAIELENLLQGATPLIWKLGIPQREIESINRNDELSLNPQRQVFTPTPKSSDNESQSDRAMNYIKTKSVQPLQTDDLSSDRGVDYTQLRNFLKAGNWQEADHETYLVMLLVVGRKKDDGIRDRDLSNFPCTDLCTIDRLWVTYSNQRFGFSVQKNIYLEVCGRPNGRFSAEAWGKFGERVGWRVEGRWISYDLFTFDTIAPVGHLPLMRATDVMTEISFVSYSLRFSSLASRLESCNI